MDSQDQAQAQLLLISNIIGPAAGLMGCSVVLLALSIPVFCRKDVIRPTLPRNAITVYTALRVLGYLLLGISLIIQSSVLANFAAGILVVGTPALFLGALGSVRRWWLNLRAVKASPTMVFALALLDTVSPFVLMTIEMFFFFAFISGIGMDLDVAFMIQLFGYLILAVICVINIIYVIVAHGRSASRKDWAIILALGLLLLPARIGSFFVSPAYTAPMVNDPGFQGYWILYIFVIAVPDVLIAAVHNFFAPSFSRMTRLDGAADNQNLIYKPQPWTMPSVSEVQGPVPPTYEVSGSYV